MAVKRRSEPERQHEYPREQAMHSLCDLTDDTGLSANARYQWLSTPARAAQKASITVQIMPPQPAPFLRIS